MRVDPLQILTKLAAVQNIPTRRVTPPFEGLEEFDYGLRRSLDPQFDWQEFGRLLLEQTPAQTLLFVEGTFDLYFSLVPQGNTGAIIAAVFQVFQPMQQLFPGVFRPRITNDSTHK